MSRQFTTANRMLDMQKTSVETMLENFIVSKAIMQWVEIKRKACHSLRSTPKSRYSNLEKFFPS